MNLLKVVGAATVLLIAYKAGEVKGSLLTAYRLSTKPDDCERTKEAFDITKAIISDYAEGKHLRVKINGKEFTIEMTAPAIK